MYVIFIFSLHSPKGGAWDVYGTAPVLRREDLTQAIQKFWDQTGGLIRSANLQVFHFESNATASLQLRFKENYSAKPGKRKFDIECVTPIDQLDLWLLRVLNTESVNSQESYLDSVLAQQLTEHGPVVRKRVLATDFKEKRNGSVQPSQETSR